MATMFETHDAALLVGGPIFCSIYRSDCCDCTSMRRDAGGAHLDVISDIPAQVQQAPTSRKPPTHQKASMVKSFKQVSGREQAMLRAWSEQAPYKCLSLEGPG